jgi:hypothetical protein
MQILFRRQGRSVFFVWAILLAGTGGVFSQNAGTTPQPPPSDGAAASPNNQLPPDIAAKAKDLKEASNTYLKLKCDGSDSKQQATARSLRDSLRDQLGNLIANETSQLPEVQGALDAATEAGEVASKTATDPGASDQEKAAAQAKFQIARTYLNDVAKAARDQIENELENNAGITLAAPTDDCPDTNKKAERRQPEKRRATSSGQGSSPGAAAPAPGIDIGIGGGGVGIGIGGGGITIGR